jgi:branched-chain amino acid transport system permease protein
MLYRRAGLRHSRYEDERQLWPLPFDRGLDQMTHGSR